LNYIKDKKIEKDYILDGYYTIATSYLELNQIGESKKYSDSLEYKLNKFSGMETKRMISISDFLKGKIFLKKGNLNESEKYLNKIIVLKNKDNILYADANNLKGEIYEIQKKIDLALNSYEIAYKEFLNLGNKRKTIKVVLNIIKLCINNNQYTKVKEYLPIYTKLKDEIFNEQVAKNMTAAEVKYETELKESKIKSQQLELEKEKTNKYIAFAGIGILISLSLGGFLFYRNRQKQKELQTQNTLLSLQQNINAMELQNLNQQLNPHEIKNLLASISPEIQEKAPESYRKMLKLFNITKASLNSNSITDTVENQVQQIEDFLSLEKNTLTEPLEYEIENNINNNSLKIPRLILKNLIENSVKHGIKGKENGGKIKVELQEKNNFIYITVDDTGKGRQNAISLDSGIGTSTYQKLFATLNQINKENATFEITDKEQGTKVEVKIPTNYKYS
jgi:sensor histidine kinase YesM